jgi:hypothetical protein
MLNTLIFNMQQYLIIIAQHYQAYQIFNYLHAACSLRREVNVKIPQATCFDRKKHWYYQKFKP